MYPFEGKISEYTVLMLCETCFLKKTCHFELIVDLHVLRNKQNPIQPLPVLPMVTSYLQNTVTTRKLNIDTIHLLFFSFQQFYMHSCVCI